MLVDESERTFVLFNAPRFLLLGLLFGLLPALRGDRRIGLAGALLVAISAAWHPTGLAKASKGLIDDSPVVVNASKLALFARVRSALPVEARILWATPGSVPDYALPAFTGRAQGPIQANLWGLNTLSAREFDERLHDVLDLPSLPPADWPAVLDRWGYSHLLARVTVPPGIGPASASRWLEAQLPQGKLVVEMAAGNLFLLARRTGDAPGAGQSR